VQRLLGECLQKDPRLRLRDIGDAKRLLESGAKVPPLQAKPRATWAVWAIPGVLAAISVNQRFEVSRDGRFLLPVLVEQEGSTPMTVVLNWPELLRRK
jgi:hypothetical protein